MYSKYIYIDMRYVLKVSNLIQATELFIQYASLIVLTVHTMYIRIVPTLAELVIILLAFIDFLFATLFIFLVFFNVLLRHNFVSQIDARILINLIRCNIMKVNFSIKHREEIQVDNFILHIFSFILVAYHNHRDH